MEFLHIQPLLRSARTVLVTEPKALLSAVLIGGVVLGSTSAAAECLDGRVSYAAPAGCPDAQYFCDRLMDRAGARLALDPAASVHVHIDAAGAAGSFEIVGLEGPVASRNFTASAADGCRELVRTIASSLVAALGTTGDEPPVALASQPSTTGEPALAPVAPVASKTPWTGEWLFGVSLSSGWAPAPTWGARVGVALRREGPLSVGMDARFESTIGSAELDPGILVDTLVLAASPNVCLEQSVFLLCADVVAGATRSASEGLEGPGTATGFTMTAGLRAGVGGVLVDGLRGALLLDVHAAVVATELRAGEVVLWRSPPVSAGLSLVVSGRIF
ncbi:MAG: hypothetical protein IPG45_28560 [Deltaproteobacteria bacterium]|jgi:hypothetical protein|nr:hypothetical protein [Deltaproteobacteria bacterium]